MYLLQLVEIPLKLIVRGRWKVICPVFIVPDVVVHELRNEVWGIIPRFSSPPVLISTDLLVSPIEVGISPPKCGKREYTPKVKIWHRLPILQFIV